MNCDRATWRPTLEAALDDEIVAATPVIGGDIGESFQVELASGDLIFVKYYRDAPIGLAACEARGLAWLSEAETPIRISRPLAHDADWLALEWIESRPPVDDYAWRLGEGLAQLHQASPSHLGFSEQNWIGRLPQSNDPKPSWAEFYGANRIQPLQRLARDAELLPDRLSRQLDRLVDDLPQLVGDDEPAARLHGDLWSGNVLIDEQGLPCLIDPACYGGHREIDLAMMRLFGGFGRGVFEAYEATAPLSPGADARVALYQIYPLLVHVRLFGATYLGGLTRVVEEALA
ncbi:MAG: fructosamine kinase family protein [bacterium]|nr:fructosamine kinase family protein [bacterium]